MSETVYSSLDLALQEVATRSFYEDATVTPVLVHTPCNTPVYDDVMGDLPCDSCDTLTDSSSRVIGYLVTDDFGTSFSDDYIGWTYEEGFNWHDYGVTPDDHSRLHEAYEFYDSYRHVAYNLPSAVQHLLTGKPVTFAYLVAEADCQCDFTEEEREVVELEGCPHDHVAGWTLASKFHEEA